MIRLSTQGNEAQGEEIVQLHDLHGLEVVLAIEAAGEHVHARRYELASDQLRRAEQRRAGAIGYKKRWGSAVPQKSAGCARSLAVARPLIEPVHVLSPFLFLGVTMSELITAHSLLIEHTLLSKAH
jgi:hypothetical protein